MHLRSAAPLFHWRDGEGLESARTLAGTIRKMVFEQLIKTLHHVFVGSDTLV
jgi:hypothetical protein